MQSHLYDLNVHLYENLRGKDLIILSKTNQHYYQACTDEFWEHMTFRDFTFVIYFNVKSYKATYDLFSWIFYRNIKQAILYIDNEYINMDTVKNDLFDLFVLIYTDTFSANFLDGQKWAEEIYMKANGLDSRYVIKDKLPAVEIKELKDFLEDVVVELK